MPERKTGRVAWIDLTDKRVEIRESPDFYGNLGGRGFGVFELLRGVGPETAPLSAENLLVFAAGSLTGTSFPGSSRIALVTKNVLSGGISTSSGGGNLGPKFRQAGFDALVVSGRSSFPCWILLKDGRAEIRDGSELWGLSAPATAESVRRLTGDPEAETASIGIASERLAAVSCVMIGRAHALAWGDQGPSWGSRTSRPWPPRGGLSRKRQTRPPFFPRAAGIPGYSRRRPRRPPFGPGAPTAWRAWADGAAKSPPPCGLVRNLQGHR